MYNISNFCPYFNGDPIKLIDLLEDTLKRKFSYLLIILHLIFSTGHYLPLVPPSPPPISANSAILMDAHTGIILFENNPHTRRYPASLTKLMTALLLLEHTEDMSRPIFMSHYAVFSIPRGSSHIAMDEGETLTVSQALYAIMLESANEVSNAIGEHIAGNVTDFAKMMTERAHSLGATNTNFTNAHGLHHHNHYTTAYDMALIKRELLNHPYFIKIIGTRQFAIPPTARQPQERFLNNTHRMIHPGEFFHYYTLGGKTGFTSQASHTLATYARNHRAGLIVITMENMRLVNYIDTRALFNYGFQLYDSFEIFHPNDFEEKINIVEIFNDHHSILTTMGLNAERGITKYLPYFIKEDDIKIRINLPDYITAPVYAGQHIGTLEALYENTVLDTINLLAAEDFQARYEMAVQMYEVEEEDEFITEEPALLHLEQFTDISLNYILIGGGLSLVFVIYIIVKWRRVKKSRRFMFYK